MPLFFRGPAVNGGAIKLGPADVYLSGFSVDTMLHLYRCATEGYRQLDITDEVTLCPPTFFLPLFTTVNVWKHGEAVEYFDFIRGGKIFKPDLKYVTHFSFSVFPSKYQIQLIRMRPSWWSKAKPEAVFTRVEPLTELDKAYEEWHKERAKGLTCTGTVISK